MIIFQVQTTKSWVNYKSVYLGCRQSVHQVELARRAPDIKPSQKGTSRTEEIQTRTVGQGGEVLGAGQSREVKISI